MHFDASTVAQVASKVMTQSLLLGAQMAGVPVATGTSGTQTGGDALPSKSAELASLEQSLAQREAIGEAQRSAVRAAARTILAVTPQLESGDMMAEPKENETRKALHNSVESTINELKTQLTLQNLQ
jgi:molecular chaperone GrpE (heat shock protein)